jgi:hypothetical protein
MSDASAVTADLPDPIDPVMISKDDGDRGPAAFMNVAFPEMAEC